MSAIHQITEAFRALLGQSLREAHLPALVKVADPTELNHDGTSLWLYQVLPDEFSRNAAPLVIQEAAGGAPRKRTQTPPLGVNLYYLVTPDTGNVMSDHDVLGQILLTIQESPLLPVRDPTLGINELVRIHLLSDTLDERVRLWEALQDKPYRLSFTCLLRTARLISSKVVEEPIVGNFTSASFPDTARN